MSGPRKGRGGWANEDSAEGAGVTGGGPALGRKQGLEFGRREGWGEAGAEPRLLTGCCGELASRRSEGVEAVEKQLGFQGLVWPQPGAGQGSLRLP